MSLYQAVQVDVDCHIIERSPVCNRAREDAIVEARTLYGDDAAIVLEGAPGFMSHDVVWTAGEPEAA